MGYRIQVVKRTWTCDACGLVVEQDETAVVPGGFRYGWETVTVANKSWLCCPECVAKVRAILRSSAPDQEK